MNHQASPAQQPSATYFNADGIETIQPDWFAERLQRVERLVPHGAPLAPDNRKVVLEWLHLDGVVPLAGGGVIRNYVLGPEPLTREGVGISFIEGGVATPIVVWGKSIQGVDFEVAAIIALNRYRDGLRAGTKVPSPSSLELKVRYPNRGSMPRVVVEQLYATRGAEVAVLAALPSIGTTDLTGLDWGARAKVATDLFARCDTQARHALLNDAYHNVRSCAVLAEAELIKQEKTV
jgi:hypothetical protein